MTKLGAWLPREIAVFDTETTGVDVEEARIVTAYIGIMDTATSEITESWSWLINPGVEIPKQASDVHGITTEKARAEGEEPAKAVFNINQRLDILHRRNLPLIAMNAAFDLTILDRELLRHWPAVRPLDYKPVFDPMVLDRAFDKYRPGKRTLTDLAPVYGVPVEANAHDAAADCLMAGRIAIKLMGHSRLAGMTLAEVHDKQIPTARNSAISLAAYWETKALPKVHSESERAELVARIKDVRERGGIWPMRPRPEVTA